MFLRSELWLLQAALLRVNIFMSKDPHLYLSGFRSADSQAQVILFARVVLFFY